MEEISRKTNSMGQLSAWMRQNIKKEQKDKQQNTGTSGLLEKKTKNFRMTQQNKNKKDSQKQKTGAKIRKTKQTNKINKGIRSSTVTQSPLLSAVSTNCLWLEQLSLPSFHYYD